MTYVIVKRAFLVRGERVEPGETVAVDPAVAVELVTVGKAEMAGEMPAVSGPMTTDSAPALKAKRSKGAKP
jgi:hypothetical protein